MFLERCEGVDDEGAFLADERDAEEFIKLAASIAAIEPSLGYLTKIGPDMGGKGDTRDWKTWMSWAVHILDRIWRLAAEGSLGESMRDTCRDRSAKEGLQRRAYDSIRRINALEVGVTHGDFRPGNVVRLPGGRGLAVIDLEDVMIDARHYDAARFLGAPDALYRLPAGSRERLTEAYTESYRRASGRDVSTEALVSTFRTIWYTRSINLWEWLPHEHGGPSYRYAIAGRDATERCGRLRRLLEALLACEDYFRPFNPSF